MTDYKPSKPTNRGLLHLRLTNQDWIECFTKLNRAELGVLFYIRTLDPFGDRSIDVNSQTIAKVLGIHRSSVSRALKKLDADGLISLEIATAFATSKAQSRAETALCMDAQAVHGRTKMCMDAQAVHGRTKMCMDAQTMCMDAPSLRVDAQPTQFKPSQGKESGSPHTNTNYIHTLSNSEREKNSVSQKEEITRSEKTSNDFSHSNLTPSSSLSNSLVKNKNLGLDQKRQPNHSLTKSLNSHITSQNSAHRSAPQTYSDFIQTLSEGEREKFLDFVTEQIKDFAQPINDVEAWLANFNKAGQNRWEVYYSKFVSSNKPIVSAAPVNPLTEQIMRRREEAMKRLTEERANLHGVSDVI